MKPRSISNQLLVKWNVADLWYVVSLTHAHLGALSDCIIQTTTTFYTDTGHCNVRASDRSHFCDNYFEAVSKNVRSRSHGFSVNVPFITSNRRCTVCCLHWCLAYIFEPFSKNSFSKSGPTRREPGLYLIP